MDHRIASARRYGRALTAALAALGVGAALIAAPAALAQPKPTDKKTQAKPAAPAPQQAQQPPQQPAQQPPQAEAPQLMYSPWMKVCGKGNEPNAKEVCTTAKDGRLENGMPVAVVQLVEPQGDPRKLLRVIVPLGMQLRPGTRLIIDQGQPATAPYSICFPVGCMADYEVNADTIAQMKKGQMLTVQAINMQGSAISLPLPLADFAKAYDGPPTDPKVFEEQQRKLQEELQKKAEEARKKLESQNQQPATQIPAAPTAPAPAPKK
ncbi:MAG TPA: invasion associated locus B family protein [Pseudolabrys sp.]|nr:invasion associated locus B family protein [Pseudolabrys sp.]